MKKNKTGSQGSLFSDKEVRRDYFKSHQWREQHLRMKVHLTGFACVYEQINHKRDPNRPPHQGREQGSLFSQQKHMIADGVEWIRQNSKYKPRIFVVTSPGFVEIPKEGVAISKLVNNMRKNYGMGEYVWVREFTKKGMPHFHFVADIDKFNPVQLSLLWSSYFGKEAKNSIRLGTKPRKGHPRVYWIQGPRMAYYMSKYIGKALDPLERLKTGRKPRTFGISQLCAKESQPLIYVAKVQETFSGLHQREFFLHDDQIEEGLRMQENPRAFKWKWTGRGQTYTGFRKLDDD
jgi:hypothetical protein